MGSSSEQQQQQQQQKQVEGRRLSWTILACGLSMVAYLDASVVDQDPVHFFIGFLGGGLGCVGGGGVKSFRREGRSKGRSQLFKQSERTG